MAQKLMELEKGMFLKSKQDLIRREIVRKINSGEYVGKLPSLRDLSKEYNANVITIQKVLKPLIKDALLTVKRGSGIYIEYKKHNCLGVIARQADKDYFFNRDHYCGEIFKQIFHEIMHRRDHFIFHKYRDKSDYARVERQAGTAGLVIFMPQTAKELESVNIPFVAIGSTFSGSNISFIDTDNESDSEKAVGKLIDRGFRRILFVCGDDRNTPTMRRRFSGYRRALEKRGIGFDPSLLLEKSDLENDFEEKALPLFCASDGAKPDALFGASFRTTQSLILQLSARGICADIGLAVYDDYNRELNREGLKYYVTILQPLDEIGKTAARVLYGLIEGDSSGSVQKLFSSKIIEEGVVCLK